MPRCNNAVQVVSVIAYFVAAAADDDDDDARSDICKSFTCYSS